MILKIELRCILFLLITFKLFLHLDWSPPVVNSIDWTWFGKAHTCLYKVPQLTTCQRKKAMRSKELSVELRDRIVLRDRSGEGYQNISAALKVPKNTVTFIILKWKKFGTTKTLPRAGQSGEKGLGQGCDQELDGHSDRAPEFLCGDGGNFKKDNHLCRTPPIRPLW